MVPGTGLSGFPMTEDIADLARRWSRAVQRGRGIRIEAADLDLLTDIGVNDIIQAVNRPAILTPFGADRLPKLTP